jgi:hypothetical protein
MKLVIVGIAFLASGMAVAAQQAGSGQTSGLAAPQSGHIPPMQISPIPMPMGCPVQLRVQHGTATGSMVEVGTVGGGIAGGGTAGIGTTRPYEPVQNLHLTLTNPNWKQIASAKVRFYGTSGKARMDSTARTGSYDSTRTMDVQFKGTTWRQVSSDVSVPGMTAVLEMDLTEVTVSDGKVWKLSGCRFTPDPLMLVSSH